MALSAVLNRPSCLQVDAELAEFEDRCSAPADRVGKIRQRERHPVRFAERLALAQDAVVPRRRLDREADGLEPAAVGCYANCASSVDPWSASVDESFETACITLSKYPAPTSR